MEIITQVNGSEPTTTTAMVADGTKNQHKNVIALVRQYQAEFDEFGRVAFETRPIETGGGDQLREVAILNEQHATLLITYLRNSEIVRAFKRTLVRAFYEARKPAQVLDLSDAHALRAALLGYSEKVIALEGKISADAPKVAFAEAIRAVDGVCSIEKIAKTIGIGRNKLFKRMRDDSILMANNLPYQKYIDREYFTVAEQEPYTDSKGVQHPTFTTMVTGAGQVFLAKRYANINGAT